MRLTRRNFLRAALLAPMVAAAAPLLGEAPTREYTRFKAASLEGPVRGQILFMANITCQAPRMSQYIRVGIID